MAGANARRKPRILVAGMGNLLMGDDGAGVHACRAWLAQAPAPRHYLVAEVGTAIYGAVHLLDWADRILVLDAMCAGGAPGSLYLAEAHDLAESSSGVSLHDLSLVGALQTLARPRPRRVTVIGLEPLTIALGTELSASVARALPAFIAEARRIVDGWRREPA